METEQLNIFNEQGEHIGTATRQEVHQLGYWHETFHCWFVSKEQDGYKLYFQIRSPQKLDYPSLLDITVAGHLLAEETPVDGVRELEEEVGIKVQYEDLLPLEKIAYTIINGKKIDNEIAHVFLYFFNREMEDFQLQDEEVSGIVKVNFETFCSFWQTNSPSTIEVEGFEVIDGMHQEVKKLVTKEHFVQHGDTYFNVLLPLILCTIKNN